jgi:hypothetical protein
MNYEDEAFEREAREDQERELEEAIDRFGDGTAQRVLEWRAIRGRCDGAKARYMRAKRDAESIKNRIAREYVAWHISNNEVEQYKQAHPEIVALDVAAEKVGAGTQERVEEMTREQLLEVVRKLRVYFSSRAIDWSLAGEEMRSDFGEYFSTREAAQSTAESRP